MPDKSSFTTRHRSLSKVGKLRWGDSEYPWETEIDASENSVIQDGVLTVLRAPSAALTTDVSTSDTETPFVFDATRSTSPHNSSLTYTWNFGDGETETGPSATTTHTFTSEGSYTVEVTVENEYGKSDTDTIDVAVETATTIISSDTTLSAGTHEYNGLVIDSDVTVTAEGDYQADENGEYGGVKIVASGDIIVKGTIDARGQGYPKGYIGPGTPDGQQYESGSGHGGLGGGTYRFTSTGYTYGDPAVADRLGSGSKYDSGGNGGGAVWLYSVNGDVIVNGEVLSDAPDSGYDGPSGGSVRLEAGNEIRGSGHLSATGGDATASQYNGGGGGGRILLKGTDNSSITTDVSGGIGYTGNDGGDGDAGTVQR